MINILYEINSGKILGYSSSINSFILTEETAIITLNNISKVSRDYYINNGILEKRPAFEYSFNSLTVNPSDFPDNSRIEITNESGDSWEITEKTQLQPEGFYELKATLPFPWMPLKLDLEVNNV